MQHLSVLACASEPPRDGGLTVTEDPLGCGWVEPFGQRSEHHSDVMRRGFQTIQGRIAPGSERGAAGLTAKGLDRLGSPMFAIANQCMEVSVSVAKVLTLRVRTSEPFSVDAFGGSSAAFDLTPGPHRRRCWPST
jgi:hypothetical protein